MPKERTDSTKPNRMMEVIAGIATIPQRVQELINTINSLAPQVDMINVSLNGFDKPPFSHPKVNWYITDGTDEQKFKKIEGDVYLSCDEDIIYPPDYVDIVKAKLEKYDIISFHGRSFKQFPIQSYYKSAASKYRCLDKVAVDISVHVGGTGVMAFYPEIFSLSLDELPYKYMADVQVAIAARRRGLRITCIAHEAEWIKYQQVTNTIYDRFKNNDATQTRLINEYF